jgi:hypothetical protein
MNGEDCEGHEREVGMTDPNAATGAEVDMAVHALHGFFAALDWLDEGWLDDKLHAAQFKAARTHLIAAGKLLCERTVERL